MSITLELEISEVDFILEALGSKSYIDVVDLISKIHEQGRPQVQQQDELDSQNLETLGEEIDE